MHGYVWRAGCVAIVISLCASPSAAVAASRMADPLANSPEQIRKAQTELQRLDCLRGPIDGKLGNQTRQAVRKFWKNVTFAGSCGWSANLHSSIDHGVCPRTSAASARDAPTRTMAATIATAAIGVWCARRSAYRRSAHRS